MKIKMLRRNIRIGVIAAALCSFVFMVGNTQAQSEPLSLRIS